jgi:hypothetical protein
MQKFTRTLLHMVWIGLGALVLLAGSPAHGASGPLAVFGPQRSQGSSSRRRQGRRRCWSTGWRPR